MRRSSDDRSSPSTYSIVRNSWPSTLRRCRTRGRRSDARPAAPSALRCGTARAARVAAERFGQELERDRLAEPQIVGAVDLAHAAAAEQADDAIPAVRGFPGREPAVVDRCRRSEPAARGRARRRARQMGLVAWQRSPNPGTVTSSAMNQADISLFDWRDALTPYRAYNPGRCGCPVTEVRRVLRSCERSRLRPGSTDRGRS